VCVHTCSSVDGNMMVFWPAENSWRAYKMSKGVKTESGIPPSHTQTKIYW